ncbi:hypothetical protein LU674_012885 [Pseudomonas alloputida]|uniref:C2H2-type domain-containing protein n=2 Tax=Pseudomonas TaxID=286 RepID=A0AAW7HJ19_9PSED|nr:MULTISPECIES: hypothetical protein [Pseudomonas]MCE0850689.1 hypothetical protein [Pseudomonas asiatica]MCE0860739.1 hypothetical protein [Pseudomonas alloputida]MCE0866762.1 hypothetical protein [Pseudomonas alloputida]MCE0889896.1 hypothetical protein [Pseudomonas alloputida]MCE0919107.1 hypothetical protein [Pseudomonas alloputida]
MPTENRSSNTEMVSESEMTECQFHNNCGGWCETRRELEHNLCEHCLESHDEEMAEQAPAPQPHPEPIAWMVGTAFWWTKEEAERDAAETGLPIVGLGPMAGSAPAQEHQGEPVAADGATFMGEPNFQHSIEWYREGISKHWKKICDLRAEVERLRAALKFYADREHYHFESGNWDTVSGEPLNILWCGEEPDFIEDGTVARAALERQS